MTVTDEVLYDPEQRFRAYVRDPDPERDPVEVLAAATPEALGLGMVTVAAEHVDALGRPHPAFGILDTLTHKWLTSLWQSGPPWGLRRAA